MLQNLFIKYILARVVWWLALSPHTKKVLGSNLLLDWGLSRPSLLPKVLSGLKFAISQQQHICS